MRDSSLGIVHSYQWEVFSTDTAGNRLVMYTSTSKDPNPLPALTARWGADTTYHIELTTGNCCGSSTYLRFYPVAAPRP
ncbi:MAG: hypothetical protein U5L96_09090 [Owenweeksia sp.]|nr:hypothetical protein [Owenweeksia sp.]